MTSYSSKELIAKIENMDIKNSSWTIGITTRPDARKEEHGNPKSWMVWQANSLQAAQNTENHFLRLGMKGGGGGDMDEKYITHVYIF